MNTVIKTFKRIDANTVLSVNKHKEVCLYVSHFNGISLENICIWKQKFPDVPLEKLSEITVSTKFHNYRLLDTVTICVPDREVHTIIIQARYKFEEDLIDTVIYSTGKNNRSLALYYFPKDNIILSSKYSEDYAAATCRLIEYDPDKKEVIKISKEEK